MELYSTEEEDTPGFDTHIIHVIRSCSSFHGFVDNKKNKKDHQRYPFFHKEGTGDVL